MELLIVIIEVVTVYFFLGLLNGIVSRCPKCKKWWAMESNGRTPIGFQKGKKEITRTDEVKNFNGSKIGVIKRTEQVDAIWEEVEDHFKCRYCGYQNNVRSSIIHTEFKKPYIP